MSSPRPKFTVAVALFRGDVAARPLEVLIAKIIAPPCRGSKAVR